MGKLKTQIHHLFGPHIQIVDFHNVGGGCINETSVLSLSNGEKLFLKKNTRTLTGMFRAEAEGLRALQSERGPRVPAPLDVFEDASNQYLLLEYIAVGSRRPTYWEDFGEQLAVLHRTVQNGAFGFSIDNYIGATPQYNNECGSWVDFFREMRLEPQIRMASKFLSVHLRKKLDTLIQKLPHIINEPDGGACLIHGDLWTGNAMVGPSGEPVLIDPAAYYGHREAEIAMTQLFGRFGGHFYDAYHSTWPLEPGWQKRMDVYNLYHMLNHVNLFGAGYLNSVSAIINQYV